MTYVYILSDYEEHGAENVVATLDCKKLVSLIDENWSKEQGEYANDWKARAKSKLNEVLTHTEEILVKRTPWNLHDGWGGIQLHVVVLK